MKPSRRQRAGLACARLFAAAVRRALSPLLWFLLMAASGAALVSGGVFLLAGPGWACISTGIFLIAGAVLITRGMTHE